MPQRNTQFAIQQRMNRKMEKEAAISAFESKAKRDSALKLANSSEERSAHIQRRNISAKVAAEQFFERQWEERAANVLFSFFLLFQICIFIHLFFS